MNTQITQQIIDHVQAHGSATVDELEEIFKSLNYDYFDVQAYFEPIANKQQNIVLVRDDDETVEVGYARFVNPSLMTVEAMSADDEHEYIGIMETFIRFTRD